jgi:hypothetical protein
MSENNILKFTGRVVAGAYYDFQEVRLSTMNRVRDIIRKTNEDIPFDAVEDKKETKTYDKAYSDKHLLLTLNKIKPKLADKEYKYLKRTLETAEQMQVLESKYDKLMKEYVESEPIYTEFLGNVRGIGQVLSANLIKEFGYCEKYQYVSSLWKHCGLDVVNGKAPKRKKGETINYNPRLRTMMWKVGDQFIKQRTPYYRDIYDKEKERQLKIMEENPEGEGSPQNKMHCHLRAIRKAEKIFLEHYFVASKELTGQEVTKPYAIAKGGHKKYLHWRDVIKSRTQ